MKGLGIIPDCNNAWVVSGHMLNCVFENKYQDPDKLFVMDARGIHDFETYNEGNNMTEKTITHPELVKALAKPGKEILKSLTAEKCDLLHMTVGISGEAGEILEATTKENYIEEFGDIEFYLEGLRQNLKIEFESFVGKDSNELDFVKKQLVINTSNLLDVVKKHVIYNKDLDIEAVKTHLVKINRNMFYLYKLVETSREEAIAANIVKLSKRYEGIKYSDKAAQDRADKVA